MSGEIIMIEIMFIGYLLGVIGAALMERFA